MAINCFYHHLLLRMVESLIGRVFNTSHLLTELQAECLLASLDSSVVTTAECFVLCGCGLVAAFVLVEAFIVSTVYNFLSLLLK